MVTRTGGDPNNINDVDPISDLPTGTYTADWIDKDGWKFWLMQGTTPITSINVIGTNGSISPSVNPNSTSNSSSSSASSSAVVGTNPTSPSYRLAESEAALSQSKWVTITTASLSPIYKLSSSTPGIKQIWVLFNDGHGNTKEDHLTFDLVDSSPILGGS